MASIHCCLISSKRDGLVHPVSEGWRLEAHKLNALVFSSVNLSSNNQAVEDNNNRMNFEIIDKLVKEELISFGRS